MSVITRQIKTTILILSAFLITLSVVAIAKQSVYAAACSNASNYGVATMTVSVPATGQYRIWSRMKVPSTAASSYQLEADGNTCWQVGGSNVPVNTWTWVDWSGGSSTQKIDYTFSAGTHTLKLIGVSTNVQVDKIILLGSGEQCSDSTVTPTGDGSNCANGPTATSTGGTTTQPPVSSGTTTPAIVEENKANAVETSYVVNGQVVQTSPGAAPLNTKNLADGTYAVETIVKLKDGSEVKATEVITVKNGRSFIQKYRLPIIAFVIVTSLILAAFVAWRIFFRGGFSWLPNKATVGSNSTTPVQTTTPNSGYVEPQVISPDKKNE